MAVYNKVPKDADFLVAQTAIQFLRFFIERRDTQKNVRSGRKNFIFRKGEQLTSEAPIAPFFFDGDSLQIAGKCAFHLQNNKADNFRFNNRDVNFTMRIQQNV